MEYELVERPGAVVLKITARTMDQDNAPRMVAALGPAVSADRSVVLDLSSVRFVNSAGLGAIVSLVRDVGKRGGAIRICSPQPTVKALFAMVHLESIASIDADLSAALEALPDGHGG